MFSRVMADRVNRIWGESHQVFRCETDGGIVTSGKKSLELHLGHKVKAPVLLTRLELIGLWLGLIK